MIALVVIFGAALVLSLAVNVTLATVLRRGLARTVPAEQANGDAQALAAKTALRNVSEAEVAFIVRQLRSLLEERERQVEAAHTSTMNAATEKIDDMASRLHALLHWFVAFTDAQRQEALERGSIPAESPETVPIPGRAAPSRNRMSPHGAPPAIEPPDSAPRFLPDPAIVASGLGPRPISRSLPPVATRPSQPGTLIGLQRPAPPAPAAPRPPSAAPPPFSKTLVSMRPVAEPIPARAPFIAEEHRGGAE